MLHGPWTSFLPACRSVRSGFAEKMEFSIRNPLISRVCTPFHLNNENFCGHFRLLNPRANQRRLARLVAPVGRNLLGFEYAVPSRSRAPKIRKVYISQRKYLISPNSPFIPASINTHLRAAPYFKCQMKNAQCSMLNGKFALCAAILIVDTKVPFVTVPRSVSEGFPKRNRLNSTI